MADQGAATSGAVLDDVSKAIIEQLQEDGRRPYAAIGKAVGLSEAAVRQRVQRLLDAGVMQIVAVTDPLQVGFPRQAMIGIRCEGDVEAVADKLAEMAEVDYVVITAGSLRPPRRGRLRGRRPPARARQQAHPGHPRRASAPRPSSTSSSASRSTPGEPDDHDHRRSHRRAGDDRSRRSARATTSGCTSPGCRPTRAADVPVIVRGEGAYICDDQGKRYLDGLAGLFVVQVGHGRTELAEAAAKQAERARVLPALVLRAPEGDRAGRAARRPTRPAT